MSIQKKRLTGSSRALAPLASGSHAGAPEPPAVDGDEQERRVTSMLDRLAEELRTLGIVF